MHMVAGGSRGPRVAVRIVNKCLTCSGAETVEKSSCYSSGTMIHRKRKRMGKSPSVCSRVVDFHCGRGTTSFVVTAENVHPAIQCAGRGFLSPHRHRRAQVPSATVLRSAGARQYNAQQQTENGSGKILSHGELIQHFLQESRGRVLN
jgi:hypothetical protein